MNYLFYILITFFCFTITNGSNITRSRNSTGTRRRTTTTTTTPTTTTSTSTVTTTRRTTTSTVTTTRRTTTTTTTTKPTTRRTTTTSTSTTSTSTTTTVQITTTPIIADITSEESTIDTPTISSMTSSTYAIVDTTTTSAKIVNDPSHVSVHVQKNKTHEHKTNGTIKIYRPKSSLPVILGAVFGGLAIMVFATSVLIYILIKQGYIKVFNQPRTRAKDTERNRIADSSSSIGGSSPSRR